MEKNEIFQGIVTKITAIADAVGTPEYTIYAKVYSEAEYVGVGTEFEIRSLNSIPTKPLGTKGIAIPIEGQKLLLFRSPTGNVAYIVGYIEDTSVSIPMYERPIEPGEYKIATQGMRPTEFSIKPNEIGVDSGGYEKIVVSQRTSDITMQSKKFLRQFHGGYEENQWIKRSGITPSVSDWSKYKENNAASDKFNIETEQPRTPIPGLLPDYVDKVIERKGAILDYSNGGELLDHVYQLETRQDVGQTGVKNTFSVLRLGHQAKMAGNLPNRQGSIIDWSTKRVNSATSATTTQYLAGIRENGEIFRSQVADGYLIRAIPGVDPAAKDQGYGLLDITTDNVNTVTNFWQSESVNSGGGGYFYRKGLGKANILHYYEEISENSFWKAHNVRKDGTINDFKQELTQDSYTLDFTGGENVYAMKMAAGEISFDYNSVSNITLKDKDISIKVKDAGLIHIANGTDNLKTLLTNLITAINTMTLKHPQGPTLPMPINAADFNAVQTMIDNLLGG